MKLIEAVDKYYEDKNEDALYENIAKSKIKFDEMEYVLKDTLGSRYDDMHLIDAIDSIYTGIAHSVGYEPLTDKDFD